MGKRNTTTTGGVTESGILVVACAAGPQRVPSPIAKPAGGCYNTTSWLIGTRILATHGKVPQRRVTIPEGDHRNSMRTTAASLVALALLAQAGAAIVSAAEPP